MSITCYDSTQMIETAELLAFAKIVDAKSVSRAALELGEPRATLSRRLARLETQLGVRLIRRTTRSLTITDAGEALYRHAHIVLDAAAQAEASVHLAGSTIRGEVRATAPAAMSPGFTAMLCEFAVAHPDVRLQIQLSSRHVDLAREGYDVAIRASARLEPGLIARKLAASRAIAVATPAYLRDRGTPRIKADLARHRLIVGFARGEVPQTQWPWRRGHVTVSGAVVANDPSMLMAAALRDLGIALVPDVLARPALDAGMLVHVLAGIVEMPTQLSVVYLERELMAPAVRAFVDHVVAWAPRAFADFPARC